MDLEFLSERLHLSSSQRKILKQELQTFVVTNAPESDGGGGGAQPVESSELQYIKVTISSAELQDLHNTAIELIEAAGENNFIELISVTSYYRFNSVAYNSQNISVRRQSAPESTLIVSSLIMGATSSKLGSGSIGIVANIDSAGINDDVEIFANGDLGSSGDGELDLYVTFRVVDLS